MHQEIIAFWFQAFQEFHNLLWNILSGCSFTSFQVLKRIEACVKVVAIYQNFSLIWTQLEIGTLY